MRALRKVLPMPVFLTTTDAGFEAAFAALLGQKREEAEDVDAAVAAIIADVRAARRRGGAGPDRALRPACAHAPTRMAFTAGRDRRGHRQRVAPEDRAALELAAERIRAYHERQCREDASWTDAAGATLGWRWTPVSAAGPLRAGRHWPPTPPRC